MLGAELRTIREGQGLSLRAAAERAGLSREALSSLERGARYPTLRTLEALCTVLNIRIVITPEETIIE